ncbi:MAG: ThiF family adenylyltransferase [Gemmatimonadetes bacterium]|nr:ThiF family adenylyltransferase [Gemmatimonadota bacterium]
MFANIAPSDAPPDLRPLTVDVAYPPAFPFARPDVRPVYPRIRRARHQGPFDGYLCLWPEAEAPWWPGDGIDRVLDGVRAWWRGHLTGHFHELPVSELASYVPIAHALRSVLIPAFAMPDRPHAPDFGDLEIATASTAGDVGIVTSVLTGPPWTDDRARAEQARLWRAVRRQAARDAAKGLWFWLETEPPPIHDLPALESFLTDATGLKPDAFRVAMRSRLNNVSRRIKWMPVGLSYPRRAAETPSTAVGHAGAEPETRPPEREWLLLSVEWPGIATSTERRPTLGPKAKGGFWAGASIRGLPAHAMRPDDLFRRSGALYPTARLTDACVLIVGLGALGSTIASSLARAGVRHFAVSEGDRIAPGNIVRHEARLPDVGRWKVEVIDELIATTNPWADVQQLPATRDRDFMTRLDALPVQPTLIVSVVAVDAVDAQLDALVRDVFPGVPVIHAWVMADAQVLRVFVFRAGQTACAMCLLEYDHDAREGRDASEYPLGPDTTTAPFFEGGCSSVTREGAGNAVALAAHIATEFTLDVLLERLDAKETHWLFAGNRIHDVAPGYLPGPLTGRRQHFGPHPRCAACTTAAATDGAPVERAESHAAMMARAGATP